MHTDVASALGGESARAPGRPRARYSVCKRSAKGEVVVFVREAFAATEDGEEWSLYCVCDGHGGAGAANYVRAHLRKVLSPLLPKAPPPPARTKGFQDFCLHVREAVIEAFVKIEHMFFTEISGELSGREVLRWINSYRSWVHKISLPESGARLLMGSSGLWDMVEWAEAVEAIRWTPIKSAASKLIDHAIRDRNWAVSQDSSALVVDILPPKKPIWGGRKSRKFAGSVVVRVGQYLSTSVLVLPSKRSLMARIIDMETVRTCANGSAGSYGGKRIHGFNLSEKKRCRLIR
eukprot:evm.model.scf_173.1 EVM.evm.TU.scf_173.1   scf_173:4518-8561(+)